MKIKFESTLPTSPREEEERRLYREAMGRFAPSKDKNLFNARVEQYVQEGLEQFDEQQSHTPPMSPRSEVAQRANRDAHGMFAPSKNPNSFNACVKQYVQERLAQFDEQQSPTPPMSLREQEAQKLNRETHGKFAPSKNPNLFNARVEQFIQEGQEQCDAQQDANRFQGL